MDIINQINNYIDLSNDEVSIFSKYLKINKINKNQIITHQGEPNNFIGFLHKGLLRSYHIDKDDNEITCHFFEEGSFFVDLFSFGNANKSQVSIQALKDSKYYILNTEDLNYISNHIQNWDIFATKYYQDKMNCLLAFHTKIQHYNSHDSYSLFAKFYKQAIRDAQKKHIASFLGLSKYTLSRLKVNSIDC